MVERTYEAGQAIVNQGQGGEGFFIIVSGKAEGIELPTKPDLMLLVGEGETDRRLAVGAGVVAYDAYKQWKTQQRAIEANRLFFYFKAGKMLGDG